MTRKELDKYFSGMIYDGIRKYAERIMDTHPEITDALVVEFAAGKMEECADDGVNLSVDDALRLTKKHAPIPTAQDFLETLQRGGIKTEGELLQLLVRAQSEGKPKGGSIPRSTAQKAARMTELGRELSNGNKDIVLMGIPADLSWDFTQLKLAFFTEDLTKEEQAKLLELKSLADDMKYTEEYGIGYAMFYLNL